MRGMSGYFEIRQIKASRLAALCPALAAALLGACSPDSTTLFHNGSVITMDSSNRVAKALLVRGNRIAAVGDYEALRHQAGNRTKHVDLGGHTIVPGFIDAHGHFPGEGLSSVYADLRSPPVGNIDSIEMLIARLREHAKSVGRGKWCFGFGYDDTLVAEKRHPTREDLDRVSSDKPVAALHVSGHVVAVNSRALELLGIGPETPDPDGGRIVRVAQTNEPNGVLEEKAIEAVRALFMSPGVFDGLQIVKAAGQAYVAAGVTTAQAGLASQEQISRLAWLGRLGRIPLRLVVWPDLDAADAILAGTFRLPRTDDEWIRIGAVKLVSDGSIQAYTGFLATPYFSLPPDKPRDYRGYPYVSAEKLEHDIGRFHEAGWQVAVHANGDAAIGDVIAAFSNTETRSGETLRRPIIVHAQTMRLDQLGALAQLGGIASFFNLHTYYWGDRHREIFLGRKRADAISPASSALSEGVKFTFHCDSPVVPIEPLRAIWAAVNRQTHGGVSIGKEEAVSVVDALRAVTIDAAYQHFEEKVKGSLEPGKLADFVVLSDSPLAVASEDLDEIRVLETYIDGELIYRAGDQPSR